MVSFRRRIVIGHCISGLKTDFFFFFNNYFTAFQKEIVYLDLSEHHVMNGNVLKLHFHTGPLIYSRHIFSSLMTRIMLNDKLGINTANIDKSGYKITRSFKDISLKSPVVLKGLLTAYGHFYSEE